MQNLPDNGFLKLGQIIGQREITREEAQENRRAVKAAVDAGRKPPRRFTRPRAAIHGVLPMGKSKWWAGVACGRYPAPVHDGPTALWSVRAIRELLDRIGASPSHDTEAEGTLGCAVRVESTHPNATADRRQGAR
jgi:hypothetical protein